MAKRPLVVITGEVQASRTLARNIIRYGGRAVAFPTIRFEKEPLSNEGKKVLQQLEHYNYLFFTSPRAVIFFIQHVYEQKITLPKRMPWVGAVGPTTAALCRAAGFTPHFVPNHFGAGELAATVPDIAGKKIIFPRSDLASLDAPRLLRKRGAQVTTLTLYTTLSIAHRALPFSIKNPPAIILFMSPSSVNSFSKQVHGSKLRQVVFEAEALCLGPTTARAAMKLGFTVIKTILPYELP